MSNENSLVPSLFPPLLFEIEPGRSINAKSIIGVRVPSLISLASNPSRASSGTGVTRRCDVYVTCVQHSFNPTTYDLHFTFDTLAQATAFFHRVNAVVNSITYPPSSGPNFFTNPPGGDSMDSSECALGNII